MTAELSGLLPGTVFDLDTPDSKRSSRNGGRNLELLLSIVGLPEFFGFDVVSLGELGIVGRVGFESFEVGARLIAVGRAILEVADLSGSA